MKNKNIRAIFRCIFLSPIILIGMPIAYLLNDMSVKEMYNNLIREVLE